MFNPDNFKWRVFNPKEGVPQHIVNWLLDDQSLTAKLRNKYSDFKVSVISQKKAKPYGCELKLLGVKSFFLQKYHILSILVSQLIRICRL